MLGESEDKTGRQAEAEKLIGRREQATSVVEGRDDKRNGWDEMQRGIMEESRNMWEIAGPAILTSVAQFSIGFITTAYVGHLGDVELAAVSIVQNVVEGFVYGVMLGLGSALETLCGQAVGAGELQLLGVYLQRSSIITLVTALLLSPLYMFLSPLLKLLNQDKKVSEAAGKFARWATPQLFAYALNFPIQKFLQAQSKVWAITIISIVVLGFHVFLNWFLISWLRYGLIGAAIAGNISWWIMVLAQMAYVVSGLFPEAWTGLTLSAFKSLSEFAKLSLASAVMLCLEIWYPSVVILLVGWLPNAEVAIDAMSICMNIEYWVMMITLGFNAAISVRVSNELGAGNHKAAKLSVGVTLVTSTLIGVLFSATTIAMKDQVPKMFTTDPTVTKETIRLGFFLAAAILVNSIQAVLQGVAVGAGWQSPVALINALCYYILGLPVGLLLGFTLNLGVEGIWIGELFGLVLQTIVLLFMLYQTNWSNEVMQAGERIETWRLLDNDHCV